MNKLNLIYKLLYKRFGPQHWWPADTVFEVMVGAILTQNTSWSNVEKAIKNLKINNLLELEEIYKLSEEKIAPFIKSAGYYNIKARRIKEFVNYLFCNYDADIKKMRSKRILRLRRELLSVKGIGPETADSILLYALAKPIFVVDAYTKRILLRLKLILEYSTYEQVQNFFMQNLKKDVELFNEYHALLVCLAKEICLKSKPRCLICPLKKICRIKQR